MLDQLIDKHLQQLGALSDVMYDGLLKPVDACAARGVQAPGVLEREMRTLALGADGTGLRFVAVEHEGNRQTAQRKRG